MSYNGAGLFLINTAGQPVVSGTTIQSTVFNAFTQDVAGGLSNAICKDGQTVVTANIPMATHKFTGLAPATSSGDSVRFDEWNTGLSIETCEFRMTLTSGTPVTTTDATGATIYASPFKGNRIALFDGTNWIMRTSAEFSIAVPNVALTMHDLFCYDNAGVPTLEALAWTNDTARATALVLQNGVFVKTGATTRRYLGSFRTAGTPGQCVDGIAFRHLWNYYNRVARPMRIADAAGSWAYTNATRRQANANAANQLDFVVGISEDPVTAMVQGAFSNTNANVQAQIEIGLDVTNNGSVGETAPSPMSPAANVIVLATATWRGFPGVGRHFLAWIESSAATGTNTFYGAAGPSAMHGELRG